MSTAVARRAPAPGAQALSAWSIYRDGDDIVAGGVRLHQVVARDLARRIGELVEDGDRQARADAWAQLDAQLGHHFAFAATAVGRQVSRGSAHVPGRVFRTSPTRAVMRVATFALVRLQPVRRQRRGRPWTPWEGSVRELYPLSTGWDERILDLQIRVDAAAVEASPLAIPGIGRPGPSSPASARLEAPARTPPALAFDAPQMPARVAERRLEAAVTRAAILSILDDGRATVRELADRLAARPAVIRVTLRELLAAGLVDCNGERWRRRPQAPGATP